MTQAKVRRGFVSLCWVIGSMLLLQVHAEVGVAVSQTDDDAVQTVIPYALSILDDQDPVGSRPWVSFNTGSESRIVLNPAGFQNGDGPPSIARGSVTGYPIVAWSRNSPAGFDVVVSVFRDRAWTEPEVVAGTAADELDPALVVDSATGAIHLLYRVADPESRVMLRSAPADLSTWNAPTRVSLLGESAKRPTGVFHAGILRVVYESEATGADPDSREVVLATQTDGGFLTETVSTVNLAPSAGASRPAVHAIGQRLWVEWIDGAAEMVWMSRVGEGPWEGSNTETFSGNVDRDFQVRSRIRAEVRQLGQ